MHRKRFLRLSSFGLAGLMTHKAGALIPPEKASPIMISTWDSGRAVNAAGWKILGNAGSALDAIENGGNFIEDQNDCCVGLSGYPDRDGIVTLDACIMDHLQNVGAVAAMERIKHAISVARKVMENTPHVLLVGKGAQQFALQNGFPLESAALSADSEKVWREWLKKSNYQPVINIENVGKVAPENGSGPFAPVHFDDGRLNHDTMGMLALDSSGNLAGGVTTSGMGFKMHGRVGDSAVPGAGLFVDNEAGAATSSGVGEEVIRICGAHLVVEFMRRGDSPETACRKAVQRIVQRNPDKARGFQVGFVALNNKGEHGAYAVQKGFVYSMKTADEDRLITAKYIFGN